MCEYVVTTLSGTIVLRFEEMDLETNDINYNNDYGMVSESILHYFLDFFHVPNAYQL